MHITLMAAEIIKRVVDDRQSLDSAIDKFTGLVDGNNSELKEICFGSCRFYYYLDGIVSSLLDKPLKQKDRIIHFVLIGSLYQLEYMQTPDHAVVNEAVDSIKKTKQAWAKNLLNGVLRKYLRSKTDIIESIKSEHVSYAFPEFVYERVKSDWPKHYRNILDASNSKPPLTLRVNTKLLTRDDYVSMLNAKGIGYRETPDSNRGVVLDKPVGVEKIPGFNQGQVSVQDESAQLIVEAMDLAGDLRILDGCAAPGGKTGLILESMSESGSLVAIDFPHRINRISENLNRLNLKATVISADLIGDGSWWNGEQFHRILLDVPCSGSGVIRRHPDIKHRQQPRDISQFSKQQLAMLQAAWTLLETGGKLLYVTCSIFNAENDQVIDKFLNENDEIELQSLNKNLGIETKFGRQRLPGVHSGDGFFYCSMKKISSSLPR